MSSVKISASLSCANLLNLEKSINEIEEAGVDFIHYDVVDGKYNNCFVFGDIILEKIRPITKLPIEVHLACEEPEIYIEPFAKAGADYIAVHYESLKNWKNTFDLIRKNGAKPIITFRPETPVPSDFVDLCKEVEWILVLTVNPGFAGQAMQTDVVNKIHQMREIIEENGLNTGIQADGNINPKTIPLVTAAGATLLTGGSSGLFLKNSTLAESCKMMRDSVAAYKK